MCTVTTLPFNNVTYTDPDDDHAPASLLVLNADLDTQRSFDMRDPVDTRTKEQEYNTNAALVAAIAYRASGTLLLSLIPLEKI